MDKDNPDKNLHEEFKRIERIHGKLGGANSGYKYTSLTPEGVRSNIIKYFKYLYDKDRYATISGLALHAGFKNRKHMAQFEAKPGFNELIEASKALIEYSYELRLKMPGVKQTGIIFALKQMGWEDKQLIESTTSTDAEVANILGKIPEKKLRAIQKLLS